MEEAQTEYHEATDSFAQNLEFVGFDVLVPAEPEPVERQSEVERTSTKARRQRRAKPRSRPHAVRVWFDDKELLKLTGSADAAGIALPEFLRSRVLKDQRARGRQAELPGGADLFAPAASAPLPVEPAGSPLSADMEERIDAYYTPSAALTAASPPDRRTQREAEARPQPFARLGHLLGDFVRVRTFGERALPPEGA